MVATEGSLIFIQESEKRRPYLCIKVFRNTAGVPYNYLVLPITSKTTVGMENLVAIVHPKLSKESYVKLNNIQTIKLPEDVEIKAKINNDLLDHIINIIYKLLKHEYNEGKIEPGTTEPKERC